MEKMNDQLNLPSKKEIKKVLKLDDNKLPSFPQVAIKLLEASKDENKSLTDLSKILETDPGISVRVLEIVNSAMYGLGRKITTLSDAVVYLGLDEIKKLALGMTVFEKMFKSGKNRQFDRLLFWRHSLATAVLSMELAKATGYPDPEEAYIAGLLHDIGKILLDIKGKINYDDFIQEIKGSTDLIIEKERESIGLGHDDIGAFFCYIWKLPEKLVKAVKYHHQPFEHLNLAEDDMLLISIVSLANFLCWTQGIGSLNIVRPPVLSPEVEKSIDLDKIDVIQCISNMNLEIESISKFYHFVFPSTTELQENLLWANLKLSKANTKYYYKEDPLAAFQDENRTDNDINSIDIDFDFGKPLAKANSVKDVLDIVMYQVGKIFQPLHWSVLLKCPKTSDLIFSVVVGPNKKKLQGIKLPKGEGIAGHIMKTGESLIIKDVHKDKRFSIRVDKYSGFQTKSIIGTPLRTDKKIFGVIELINRISDQPFTSNDLEILSSIAEYAGIAIERSYYNQALTNLATKDNLTGFKNRLSFERIATDKDKILKKYGSIFSMLIIKTPPLTKDNILKDLAQAITKTKRHKDDIFRYGEDAFVLLLPHTYSEGTKKAKHRISKAFSKVLSEKNNNQTILDISTHTISSDDSDQLKTMIGSFLAKSIPAVNSGMVEEIEENLQPLLEEETLKQNAKSEKTKAFGKAVSLGGRFIRLKNRETGHIRVENISLESIGFRISKSHRIQVNDFIDIHFILDDIKKSMIKRRSIIRTIEGNLIYADFYNPPPYAKKLGFYLMN